MKHRLLKFLKKELKLHSLKKHQIIGVDLDGTLISGPYHKEIQQWAKETKAQLHVITFRKNIDDLAEELLKFPSIVAAHTLPRDIAEFSNEYLTWKGLVCHKIGASALVDDDILAVMAGCQKYKIQLFNSLKWPQYDTDIT